MVAGLTDPTPFSIRQLLCRNSSLGSPSPLCGSPPGSLRKPPNIEGIVFPGESGLAPGSYKKAPGFEREDQVGAEYLKNFKCQVRAQGAPRWPPCSPSPYRGQVGEVEPRAPSPVLGLLDKELLGTRGLGPGPLSEGLCVGP